MSPHNIIAIGASLGGLDALSTLLGGLPAGLNASVLIVLHSSRESPLFLANIFGRCTPLVVAYGQHGSSIEPGHVYIAPPDHHMTVLRPGLMRLDDGPKVRFCRPAIDPLFRSAAAVYGPRVIGVVLTGQGEDGSNGLQDIKAGGGISVVQDPDEARAPQMPRSALIGDRAALRVSLNKMADLLVRLVTG